MLNYKKILVTGSEGQLGRTLQKRSADINGFDWIFLSRSSERTEMAVAFL